MTKDEAIAEAEALLREVEAFKFSLTLPGLDKVKAFVVRICRLLVYVVGR